MLTKVDLHTSHNTFEALHRLADTRKAAVKVSRDDLIALLMDHSSMVAALEGAQFTVAAPRHRRRRLDAEVA